MVGRVGVAQVGVVVEEGVALAEVRVDLRHRLAQELHADHVHRQPFRGGEQLLVGGHDGAGEVARHVEHRRPPRPEQRVRHLAADRVQPVRHHGEQDRIELSLRYRAHAWMPLLFEEVVAGRRHGQRPPRVDDHGRRGLLDDRRPAQPLAGRERRAQVDGRVDGAVDAERGLAEPAPRRWAGTVRLEVRQPRLRQGGRSATLPVDALEVLAGLLHREDALVDVVERLDHPLDVAVVGERAGAERHLELPDLVRVARLDEELLAPLLGPRVETIEELVDLSVELRETLVDRVEVEAVRVHAAADARTP